MKIYRRS